jgi:hypothetical protein
MLFTIITALTGLGGVFKSISADISNVQIAKVNAQTQQEKDQLNLREQELHDKRAVIVAEAGSRINAIMRALAAIGPILYLFKVFVFDKVIGSLLGYACFQGKCSIFTTDKLDDNLWGIVLLVLSFYFVADLKNLLNLFKR